MSKEMDKDLAEIALSTLARCNSEMGYLVSLLKEHADEQTAEVRLRLVDAISDIQLDVMDPIFKMFPELEVEFEARLKKYSRSFP